MDRAPSYLSQAKAETILSEVRPTKLRTETLICVNVFLDELLWLVLSTARSFSTDRLKIGLLKVLPTTVGKDALLEAELELKAYWEKTGLHVLKALENTPTPSATDFPLQAAFELLRHKCEAYSTLGDLDEDADVEARLQARMIQAASNPPSPNAVAPAALYLTAVLEHVCEHILGNLARVVGRDASRATAQVGDLYVALCEDETIYGLFKTMKVQEQIDRQSKSPRPRRSKSFNRGDNSSSSRTASPQPQSQAMDKTRSSAEASNGGLLTSGHAPSSSDKMRGLKMFKNSSMDAQLGKDHQRSMSVMSDATKRTMVAFQNAETEGENAIQDFDDLMKSGTTMKVSLTPDRLKTFEVYNKQKIAKASRPTPTPSANAEPAPPFKSLRPVASSKSIGRSLELTDERESANLASKRNHSIATPAEAGIRINQTRRGSGSSGSTPPSTNPTLLRKASAGNGISSGPSSFNNNRRTTESTDMSNGMPKRNRPAAGRGPARNRESLDLDDVMDLEGEMAFGPPPMLPKAAAPAGTSSSTRDLIDFLSEGPPETPDLPPLQTNLNVTEKAPKSASRLRSMFSRGNRQSNEVPTASASASNLQRQMNGSSSLGRSNSNLKKQRSVGNLDASRQPPQPLPPVEYPRPPQYVRSSAPPSPTHSSPPVPQATPADVSQATSQHERSRHISVTRKAAPVWDGQSSNLPVPSPTLSPGSPSNSRPPPPSPKNSLPSTLSAPTNGYPVQLNVSNTTTDVSASPSSPPTPSKRSGLMPTPRSAGIPNLPAAKAVDVTDMRKKLAKATSVPEARLLVDMFLAQWGFPADRADGATDAPAAIVLNGGEKDDTHGVGIVEMLLGEGTDALQSQQDSEDAQGQAYKQTTSPTQTQEPMSASSLSAFKITTPTKGVRVDTKQSPTAVNSPGALSAGSTSNISHGAIQQQHHHRYGNGSPVVVG